MENAKTVDRKVRFYRVDMIKNDEACPVPWEEFTDHILSLKKEDRAIIDIEGEKPLICIPDKQGRFRFVQSRRSDFPYLETDLEIGHFDLKDNQGFAYMTHVSFHDGDKKSCIVAELYNHFGPRIGQIARYFAQKTPAEIREKYGSIRFQPIIRKDYWDKVKETGYVEAIEIRMIPSHQELLFEAKGKLGTTMSQTMEKLNAGMIVLQFRQKPYARKDKHNYLDYLKEAVDWIKTGLGIKAEIKDIRFKGAPDQVRAKDLPWTKLSEDLISQTVKVVQVSAKSKVVEDISAYGEMKAAYDTNKQALLESASVESASMP